MPGTNGALIQAAKNSFTMRSGPMCHDAVFEWLQNAGYVEQDAHRKIFSAVGDRSTIFARILVRDTDIRVMEFDQFNHLPPGTIIGFWKDGKIMHSIITLGNRLLAGANNGGIFDPSPNGTLPKIHENLRAIFLTSQTDWHSHNSTVGGQQYTVHWATPETVATRIKSEADKV